MIFLLIYLLLYAGLFLIEATIQEYPECCLNFKLLWYFDDPCKAFLLKYTNSS